MSYIRYHTREFFGEFYDVHVLTLILRYSLSSVSPWLAFRWPSVRMNRSCSA